MYIGKRRLDGNQLVRVAESMLLANPSDFATEDSSELEGINLCMPSVPL